MESRVASPQSKDQGFRAFSIEVFTLEGAHSQSSSQKIETRCVGMKRKRSKPLKKRRLYVVPKGTTHKT
jgi:hypothetical protein